MSLVRELESKRAIEKKQVIEAAIEYLRSVGTEVVQGKESTTSMLGTNIIEPVIQLVNGDINLVRLISTDYISYRITGDFSRFQYEVSLNKKLTPALRQHIATVTKLIKGKKMLGLFGGEVIDINWVGRGLARLLNNDSEISRMLLECATSLKNLDFRIQVKSQTTVMILGPSFAERERITNLFKFGLKEPFEECVFGYKICNRIARHIKELVEAG